MRQEILPVEGGPPVRSKILQLRRLQNHYEDTEILAALFRPFNFVY